MRRIRRIVIWVCLLAVAFALPAFAAEEKTHGLYSYELEGDGTVKIVGYDWSRHGKGDLIVPGTIDGYAVTEIGDNAFNAENIKGWYRRKPEERITAILPNTLTAIGDKAFFFCDHIATINIPASVRRIGSGAFSNTAIRCSVDSGNDDFTTIQNVLYNKGQKKLIHCPQDMVSGDNPLTIPNGIVAIGDYALYNCDGYGYTAPDEVMVVLPGTLKQIGDYAFAHCDLGSMTIPDGVTQIGAYAFQDSTFHSPEAQDHGWSLYLPASVESIGEGCFEGWMGVDTVVGRQSLLSNVYLQETQIATIPRRAFAECRLINTTPPPRRRGIRAGLSSRPCEGDRGRGVCRF